MAETQTKPLPRTLVEAIRYFADPAVCIEFVARMRWAEGPVCPSCGCLDHSYLSTRHLWKCKACKRQFSVKVGTIFEDSAIPLDKWLCSMWLIANSKNGVSSHELARSVGITQKSAWFVLHRIRLAMQARSLDKFHGDVEVDETFIGGKARFMHKDKRERKITGTGGKDKTIVAGTLRRTGDAPSIVRTAVVADRTRRTLNAHVRGHVEAGANVFTDAHVGYTGLEADYAHETIDHAVAYVDGQVHTNGIENFWALLKRGLHGTYVSVQPFHLFRYLDERAFTFNHRDADDLSRFALAVAAVSGRRLTWKALTA